MTRAVHKPVRDELTDAPAFGGAKGSRPVHLRSVRPARRVDSPMGTTRADRKRQVRALCGAWVSTAEAVRVDGPAHSVTCEACRTGGAA